MNDKDRQRYLKAAFKAREQESLEAAMPMEKTDLRDLLNYLDRPECLACDHTLKETIGFLNSRVLNSEAIVPWLKERGGFCDCEVLANVKNEFERILGREKK
jgi:hypothetical protein